MKGGITYLYVMLLFIGKENHGFIFNRIYTNYQ